MSIVYTNVFKHRNEIRVRGFEKETGARLRRHQSEIYQPTMYYPSRAATGWSSLRGKPLRAFQFDTMEQAYAAIETNRQQSGNIFGMDKFVTAYIHDAWADGVDGDFSRVRIAYIDIETTGDHGFPRSENPIEMITAITVKINGEITTFGLGDFSPPPGVRYIQGGVGKTADIAEQMMLYRFLAFWFAADIDIVSGWNVRGFDIPYLYARMQLVLDGHTGESKYPFEYRADALSPYGIVRRKVDVFKGKVNVVYDIKGLAVLDYLVLYRAYGATAPMENFKLETVAQHELGRGKCDIDEIGGIKHAHQINHQKFIEYNIRDTELVEEIEQKKQLIRMVVSLAWMTRVNFEDVLHQTRVWDSIIYGHLLAKNIVVPVVADQKDRDTKYRGAYVMPPVVGTHRWVVSFDLNSLYPHLIMQYNIGPETLVPGNPINDLVNPLDPSDADYGIDKIISGEYAYRGQHVCAANGHEFSRDRRSFLSELMEYFYELRKAKKSASISARKKYQEFHEQHWKDEAERLNIEQNAIKVLLNSAYGACGNAHFRFFDVRLAEAITLSGRLSIRWIVAWLERWISERLGSKSSRSHAVAADTDSVYLRLDDWVKAFCPATDRNGITDYLADAAEHEFQDVIDEGYADLARRMKVYAQKMKMKRETIADIGVWTAKKRYILNALDEEGVRYRVPKVKMVGVDAIRSTIPALARRHIRNVIRIMLQKSESDLHRYAGLFRERIMLESGPHAYSVEDIAIPSGVSNVDSPIEMVMTNNAFSDNDDEPEVMEQVIEKGMPIHVKAASRYNQWLDQNRHRGFLYEPIMSGSKMKYVHTIQDGGVFGFSDILPSETGKRELVDRSRHFEKIFAEPLASLLEHRGWSLNEQITNDEFMDLNDEYVRTKYVKKKRKKALI